MMTFGLVLDYQYLKHKQKSMQKQHPDEIQQLIKRLISKDTSIEQLKLKKTKTPPQERNPEIEQLDISDYLQLLAHQKKNINKSRWTRLTFINQSRLLEQQDYKYFLAVASQAHYRRLQHPGYFKLLLERRAEYPPAFFSSIQKDVPRTLQPGHAFSQPLRNVLVAYAIRNPSLAYCQGMNYLVAYMLINQMSAQQAFWTLACIIENCLPDDYFKDLTTISILSCIFDDLLGVAVPQFKNLLMEAGMDSSAILVPWLVCLFAKNFINSVSAYLIGYFMLQSQKQMPGFVLLKISVGIISAILAKDEDLPFSRDFKTIKDCIDLRVFEVSLNQIQEALETVPLNYQAYIQLQNYYRKQKQQARQELLKSRRSNKKMSLPPCNQNYPVCLHRIQIQKKLGAIESAVIIKNGMTVQQQMIQNYLMSDQSEQIDISYITFEQCAIGRPEHVCHLNQIDSHSKVDVRGHTFERDVTHHIELIDSDEDKNSQDGDESVQQELRLSTYEERFREVTDYFEVDQLFGEEVEDKRCQEELQKEFEEFKREKPENQKGNIYNKEEQKQVAGKKGFRSYLSNVIGKATDVILQLQKGRKGRRSQTLIEGVSPIEKDCTQSQPGPTIKKKGQK